jgi:parvulin-like peptidyl-prolyl isomerase
MSPGRAARRIAHGASVALCCTLLAGCGLTRPTAAEVGGVAISRAELETTLADLATVGQGSLVGGVAPGDSLRGVLTALIEAEATRQLLIARGEAVTNADRAAARAAMEAGGQFGSAPAHLETLVLDINAALTARARLTPPPEAEMRAAYASRPASLGALCLRHLVVGSRTRARELRARVLAGASFAEIAAAHSEEPAAAGTGGALGGASGDCLSLREMWSSFDRDFNAGALRARPGTPSEPVRTSFGWHLIWVRPYDEVADDLRALAASDAGAVLLDGLLATSDISVASGYGRWDPAVGRVEPNT